MEKFKRNPLAASVMTGVTALLGGIEPASAAAETHSFGVSVSDLPADNVTVSTSGLSFFDNTNTTAPTSFLKFDDQGGTLTLTQVVVKLITDLAKTQLNVVIGGNCGDDFGQRGSTGSCSSSGQNASEFSALIDLGSGIGLGADQDFSTATVTPGCEFTRPDTCHYNASNTLSNPLVLMFSATITGADLALFTGSGSFNVTPGLGLGGPFSATVPFDELTEPFNDYAFSATTNWQGTIDVTYTFEENGTGVPEPATLLLFGTGLAGLGLLRRKPKSSA